MCVVVLGLYNGELEHGDEIGESWWGVIYFLYILAYDTFHMLNNFVKHIC